MAAKRMNKSSDRVSELQADADPFDEVMLDDPDDAAELVREGIASYERGEYITINGSEEAKLYFDGLLARAKQELDGMPEDPDNAAELVLEGIEAYERGEFIELKTDGELKSYLEGIKERGRKDLAN